MKKNNNTNESKSRIFSVFMSIFSIIILFIATYVIAVWIYYSYVYDKLSLAIVLVILYPLLLLLIKKMLPRIAYIYIYKQSIVFLILLILLSFLILFEYLELFKITMDNISSYNGILFKIFPNAFYYENGCGIILDRLMKVFNLCTILLLSLLAICSKQIMDKHNDIMFITSSLFIATNSIFDMVYSSDFHDTIVDYCILDLSTNQAMQENRVKPPLIKKAKKIGGGKSEQSRADKKITEVGV